MTVAPDIEVAEYALRALGSTLDGYANPDGDGECARVIVVGGSVEAGFFDVQICRFSSNNHVSMRYRVSVVVSPPPAEQVMRRVS